MNKTLLLSLCLLTAAAAAEPIDNCASLLGSISVELRYARNLAPGVRTTFVCPRDTKSLLGASKQRILNSLGTPDFAEPGADGSAVQWSYFFSGARAGERGSGIPVLAFSFDGQQQVSAISCQATR
jgi:hypothetical protein